MQASNASALPVVAVTGITKEYPSVRALNDVSLDLRRGEVHALVGENGAGKSTLIRILSGDARPDAGKMSIDGTEVVFSSPADARRRGIVAIFQELMIVPDLSVVENVLLGAEPGLVGVFYSRREAERRTASVLERLGAGAGLDPARMAGELSTAQKQLVEIARALVLQAPVIIMDEPTAALSEREASGLLRIVRQLRSEDVSILFVSHRLEEVRSIADRITVLRGGRCVETIDVQTLTDTSALISLMIGRPISELYPPRNRKIGNMVLSVRRLRREGVFEFDRLRRARRRGAGLRRIGRRRAYRSGARCIRRRPCRRWNNLEARAGIVDTGPARRDLCRYRVSARGS